METVLSPHLGTMMMTMTAMSMTCLLDLAMIVPQDRPPQRWRQRQRQQWHRRFWSLPLHHLQGQVHSVLSVEQV